MHIRTALVSLVAAAGPAGADMLDTDALPVWETCALCHGLDGRSAVGRFPHLAGLGPAYIEKQLRDFRNGLRRNDGGQMATVAAALDDAGIVAAAGYFGRLPPSPARPDVPAADPDGRACDGCHAGGEATAPSLAGQQRDYLAKQLREFRSGARANDVDGVMRAVTRRLNDETIERLADHYAGAAGPRSRNP